MKTYQNRSCLSGIDRFGKAHFYVNLFQTKIAERKADNER